jgi:hypothetical protein
MPNQRHQGARRLAAMTVVAAVIVAVAGCNGDDDADNADNAIDRPATVLSVEVSHPDHPTLRYEISCNGADGPMITGDPVDLDADAACEILNDPEVVDRLVDGPDPDRMCTQVYGGPDEASFTGTIDQMQVNTQVDRTDGCGIEEWDDLLDDLLPPAR